MALDWPDTGPYKLSSAISHSIRVPGMLLNTLLKVHAATLACFVAAPSAAGTCCILVPASTLHFGISSA